MIPNNNLSILPFHTDISKQNHRKSYSDGQIFNLATPYRHILPFQIIREHSATTISEVLLKNQDGSTFADITAQMTATGLHINDYTAFGHDIIMYHGQLPLLIDTPENAYYLQLNDGTKTYYSDIFNIINDLSDYLKITYWCQESMIFENGRIDYSEFFKFNIYLIAEIGRPEYEFEEVVEKRDGYSFIEKQISTKTYKFTFLAPEFICDAMRVIRMTDNVIITSQGDSYTVDSFLITPKWSYGAYIAEVETEFQCDTIIKKVGNTYSYALHGDFNDDFNDDFNNV